ncbi:MAG: hypothetical protein HKO04_14770 [Silicimonas sp.]|nr:hypothetical protein [Silicimonas sp.]
MSDPLEVRAGEHGIVRVFTTDLDPEGDAAITAQNVAKLLGEDISLDPKKVEVFPARMIESLGLSAYLREGYGIPEDGMAGKAAVLEALSGLVILIPSSAFQGKAATLDPNPGLRFIAAFSEEPSAPPERMAPRAASDGTVAPPDASVRDRSDRGRMKSWVIALASLLAAAALVLLVLI